VAATDSLQTPDRAVRIAADLVNTGRSGVETLPTAADLRRFLLDHAEPEPVTVTAEELARVRAVRQRLRVAFETDDPHEAAHVLNDLLAAYAARPYLSDHDGTPWHLHVTGMEADWAQWIGATTAMGLAVLVAGHGFDVLRRCPATGCERVFIATSRRQTRRYCSPTCASRTRVTAHRIRKRQ
jgi:predicted RNA-binding Zn ribbon-like protein